MKKISLCIIFLITAVFVYGQNTVIINQYNNAEESQTKKEVTCTESGQLLWNGYYCERNSINSWGIRSVNGSSIINIVDVSKEIVLLPNGNYKVKNSLNSWGIRSANGSSIINIVDGYKEIILLPNGNYRVKK
jgi:hypothetical protein